MTRSTVLTSLAACTILGWAASVEANVVAEWNALAVQCTGAHRGAPGQVLDIAIAQAAVHNAVQAIEGRYEPYLAGVSATGGESRAAAAAAAAYNVLATVCPNSVATLLAPAFKPYLDGNDPGLAVGAAAATQLLAKVRPAPAMTFIGGTGAGEWQPQPPATNMAFVYLATTEPFTMTSPTQFLPGPPPAMTSERYLRDYNEVKEHGNIESHPPAPACPAPRETDMARFWGGNLILQWNDTVRNIAVDRQLSIGETARLLALATFAGADALIAVWDSKIHYNFWRPIAAIRRADEDPNAETERDVDWIPFIQGPHFPPGSQTPAYPDYVSGANGVTGAYVTILQMYFRTNAFRFEIYKGTAPSVAICTNPRTFRRFSDAAQEVVDARILLGIHFRFADTEARRLGARVGFWTFTNALRPVGHGGE